MKINIVGRGNVATHLSLALGNKAEVIRVNPRSLEEYSLDADITLIAVSDNAIREVAESLPVSRAIIAHTSGSTPIGILDCRQEKTGVFYPLQTFTKGICLDYSEIPLFIEASDKETETKLKNLAHLFSNNVATADSSRRKVLHVASVFACNFTNHLWCIADELLKEQGMSFATIRPLLKETLRKTGNISPFDSQTGPAVRRDSKTLDSHLSFLKEKHADLAEIYDKLSASIISTHKKDN